MGRVRAKAYKSLINPGKRRLENHRSKCVAGPGCPKFSVDMPFKNSVTKYHNVVVGWCGLRLLDESFRNLPLLFSFLRSI